MGSGGIEGLGREEALGGRLNYDSVSEAFLVFFRRVKYAAPRSQGFSVGVIGLSVFHVRRNRVDQVYGLVNCCEKEVVLYS